MKKILTAICISAILSSVLMTGCTKSNTTNGQTQPTTQFEATYPGGKEGKIDKSLLDSDNLYELYSPLDRDHEYPIESFQCKEDGTIDEGDIYKYDASYNVIQQDHYVGKILDYVEIREYDSLNNNTKIISYAGAVDRNNLVSTQVMEYDKYGNEISSKTYDSDNILAASDKTEYTKVGGVYLVKCYKAYDVNNNMTEKHEYSYRSDGTASKDIRTQYDEKGNIKYYYQTAYDSQGEAISYDYFDKDGNKIPTPKEEKEMYGE